MSPAEREIRALHTAWIAAVNAGDLDRLLALTTTAVLFLAPGQDPFGRDEFSAGFRSAHRQFAISCLSELEDVVIVGPVAYTRSRDTLSVTPRAGGAPARLAGHRLTVYRQQPDGRWLLDRDAHTLTPIRT